MMDMEWTIPEVKDGDQYKASDNISDGELIERDFYRSKDESKELEGIKKNHSKTQEKEKVAEVPPYPGYVSYYKPQTKDFSQNGIHGLYSFHMEESRLNEIFEKDGRYRFIFSL